jgi:UDP-N-acetylglucosamine--N-acetylmuramyl-(pentapeptide) pyrophosphoryl-undecaprenol N-acetylglucosamine transferase
VPFAAAIDDHQTRNARHFANGGAALVIAEPELTPEGLARSLAARLGDLDGLAAMAEAAHAQAKHAVAERIADACVEAAEVRA